jgi:hypothetical protein
MLVRLRCLVCSLLSYFVVSSAAAELEIEGATLTGNRAVLVAIEETEADLERDGLSKTTLLTLSKSPKVHLW